MPTIQFNGTPSHKKNIFKQITSRIAYCFTNTEPLIDFATPTINRVIPLGGLGAKAPKELDEVMSVTNNVAKLGVKKDLIQMIKTSNKGIQLE